MSSDRKLTVYYDGACPICTREIDFYRRRRGAAELEWLDVSAAGAEIAPDLSKADALAKFHVRDAEGRLVSGGGAFAALWRTLPAFRWLGVVAGATPARQLIDLCYLAFLKIRPSLQRLAPPKPRT